MLRKRTSFKPNLKQVTSSPANTQPQSSSQCTSNQPADCQQSTTNADQLEKESPTKTLEQCLSQVQQQDVSLTNRLDQSADVLQNNKAIPQASPIVHSSEPNNSSAKNAHPTGSTALDVTNERVQEAITQLTGQKFEPIKSLSLRSSANKNVKLKDLLFFNPPMTKDQKRHKKSASQAKKNERQRIEIDETAKAQISLDGDNPVEDEEELSLVPKVKMGPGGKLILDESSTVINRKNSIREQTAIIEDSEDVICKTNYDSFRRRPASSSQTKWSSEDTSKFYHALTILGTDFSMMESLLFAGSRSRTELHKKFKREERLNKLKIDIALSSRISLSSEELEDLKEIFYK